MGMHGLRITGILLTCERMAMRPTCINPKPIWHLPLSPAAMSARATSARWGAGGWGCSPVGSEGMRDLATPRPPLTAPRRGRRRVPCPHFPVPKKFGGLRTKHPRASRSEKNFGGARLPERTWTLNA
jgi:hypothetical protein